MRIRILILTEKRRNDQNDSIQFKAKREGEMAAEEVSFCCSNWTASCKSLKLGSKLWMYHSSVRFSLNGTILGTIQEKLHCRAIFHVVNCCGFKSDITSTGGSGHSYDCVCSLQRITTPPNSCKSIAAFQRIIFLQAIRKMTLSLQPLPSWMNCTVEHLRMQSRFRLARLKLLLSVVAKQVDLVVEKLPSPLEFRSLLMLKLSEKPLFSL
jgi:hypothetical protein